MLVEVHELTGIGTPFSVTLLPQQAGLVLLTKNKPKRPEIVTVVPIGPDVGETPLIQGFNLNAAGVGVTGVELPLETKLAPKPFETTETEYSPAAALACVNVAVSEESDAEMIETVIPAGVIWITGLEPNPDPVMVTLVGGSPSMAEAGVAPEITGVGSHTVKFTVALPKCVLTVMERDPPAAFAGIE